MGYFDRPIIIVIIIIIGIIIIIIISSTRFAKEAGVSSIFLMQQCTQQCYWDSRYNLALHALSNLDERLTHMMFVFHRPCSTLVGSSVSTREEFSWPVSSK